MPDITVSASLDFYGGVFRDTRVAPASLTFGAGDVTMGSDTQLTAETLIPKLDRLNRISDKASGETQQQFQRRQLIWQQSMEAIEAAFEAVNSRVDELAILARLTRAEGLAEVANDNAIAAQESVSQVTAAVSQTMADIDPIYQDAFDDRIPQNGDLN